VKLHFLGTTGYHPNNQRQTACLMIPEAGIILDAGTGMFRARELIRTRTLHILLSHVHLDHCIGITYLFDVVYEKDVEQVIVYSERDKIEALKHHLFAEPLFPAMPDFEFKTFENSKLTIENIDITTFPLINTGGSLGFCLEFVSDKTGQPAKVAYVTDTTAKTDAAYVQQIHGADLLIHECYLPDGAENHAELTGHSCLTPVCQVAKQANVGELMLVHINPLDEDGMQMDLAAARKIFPNVSIPDDLQSIEI
jgi:ribonuclease BN (tRNA processing enzyme)